MARTDVLTRTIDSIRRDPGSAAGKALAYPRMYAAAAGARRRLRALPEELTLEQSLDAARSFRWGGRPLAPAQVDAEILELLELLSAEQPRRILEIGTFNGGTLFLWTRVAAPDALLVTIDAGESVLADRSPLAYVCRSLARRDQRIETLFRADSHDPRALERVQRLFEGAPVDFLFIDGDHRYEGAKLDFEMYGPLVRPGGIIALHDIGELQPEVARLWRELRDQGETQEIVAEGSGAGIGVYRPR